MHETTSIDREPEDAMIKPMTTLGAAAAGALAMYYLDPELGERRRARAAGSGVGHRNGSRSPTRAVTPTCAAACSRGSAAS